MKSFRDLDAEILHAVRDEAAKIPDFECGAVRRLYVPKCVKTLDWLLGLACDVDLDSPIREGGSVIRPVNWRGSDVSAGDCYGWAALKIMGCAEAIRQGLGYRSCGLPQSFVDESWGLTNDQGCVAYDIHREFEAGTMSTIGNQLFVRIFISVSGATSAEDERCALAGGEVIRKWCAEDSRQERLTNLVPYLHIIGKPDLTGYDESGNFCPKLSDAFQACAAVLPNTPAELIERTEKTQTCAACNFGKMKQCRYCFPAGGQQALPGVMQLG
ncbi:hypothetical protein FWF48_02865 [Candidatus Saccharibacteria bacterium]|nr:hypothetical protein [Candidatus Saccharibacteria bacterium]